MLAWSTKHDSKDILMTFEFGETDEANVFFDRNPSFVPFFDKLMAVANKCFGRRVDFKNHLEDVVFSQGHTCRDDYTEVVFLAVNGYANGAGKILRGLYERTVTLAYIGDSNERARRFHRYSGIQAHRAMEAALKLFPEEDFEKIAGSGTIARMREWYKEVKPEYQTTLCKKCGTTRTQSSWDIDFASMVQKVGEPYRMYFLNAYAMPTLHIHATMTSGFDGRDPENETSIQNRRRECDLTLYTASDFVFPSLQKRGSVPLCASVFCRVHLRPAAKEAGVVITDGHRWGLHNLRHSLANWLVNKAKENPKTVQGILGHARVQTVFDLYTDEDLDEMISAQDKFVDAVGIESKTVQ